MKIARLQAHPLNAPIPECMRVDSGDDIGLNRQMVLIEISTGAGITGVGSPSGPDDLAVCKRIVEDVIGPHLVGQDPSGIPLLRQRAFHGEVSRNLGHRSVGIACMAGIEIALWDLKGRATGRPRCELSGGKRHRDGVRACAGSTCRGLTPGTGERIAGRVEKGCSAARPKAGRVPSEDIANPRAMRKRVGGGAGSLTDADQSPDRRGALKLLRVPDDIGSCRFEEPIPIGDIEGHRMLRDAGTPVRIATDGNLYARNAFRDCIREAATDVPQTDCSRAGGIADVRGIVETTASAHLAWNPRTFNDIITVAADLHLVAASPHPATFGWDITHTDPMTKPTDRDRKPEGGTVRPPSGPGPGFGIDRDFVEAHAKGEPAIGAGHGMRRWRLVRHGLWPRRAGTAQMAPQRDRTGRGRCPGSSRSARPWFVSIFPTIRQWPNGSRASPTSSSGPAT